MKVLNFNKFAAVVALVLGCSGVFAQKGTTDPSVSAAGEQPVKEGWMPSIPRDGVIDRVQHVGAPIPWQPIREADVLWKKRVWRLIDVREKQNIGFRYQGDENTGGGMFIEILLDGVKRGKITAYSSIDAESADRFTIKMTKEQLMEKLTPPPDSTPVEDPVTGKVTYKLIEHIFRPEMVSAFRLKEDWIFDRNIGKMVVRIIGIAPVIDKYSDDGIYLGPQALFWLYYPEIRNLLANYEVFNPDNDVFRYTWDEFFESRQFASKIYKVSNPLNQQFKEIYGEDARGKMESLYEGQQTANEIFNKEHDMWVY